VRGIDSDEILASPKRDLKRFFEQRQGGRQVARQSQQAATLKQHTRPNDVIVASERIGVGE